MGQSAMDYGTKMMYSLADSFVYLTIPFFKVKKMVVVNICKCLIINFKDKDDSLDIVPYTLVGLKEMRLAVSNQLPHPLQKDEIW
jgi:hypothetical protein